MCLYVWIITMVKYLFDDPEPNEVDIYFFYDDGSIKTIESIEVDQYDEYELGFICGIEKSMHYVGIPVYKTSSLVPSKKLMQELTFPLIDGH